MQASCLQGGLNDLQEAGCAAQQAHAADRAKVHQHPPLQALCFALVPIMRLLPWPLVPCQSSFG